MYIVPMGTHSGGLISLSYLRPKEEKTMRIRQHASTTPSTFSSSSSGIKWSSITFFHRLARIAPALSRFVWFSNWLTRVSCCRFWFSVICTKRSYCCWHCTWFGPVVALWKLFEGTSYIIIRFNFPLVSFPWLSSSWNAMTFIVYHCWFSIIWSKRSCCCFFSIVKWDIEHWVHAWIHCGWVVGGTSQYAPW